MNAIDTTPSVGADVVVDATVDVVLVPFVDVDVDVDVDVGVGHHDSALVVGHHDWAAPKPARVPTASDAPSPLAPGPDALRTMEATTTTTVDAITMDALRAPATQQVSPAAVGDTRMVGP